jgi:thiol-disulfide isomerase/thioredoxin
MGMRPLLLLALVMSGAVPAMAQGDDDAGVAASREAEVAFNRLFQAAEQRLLAAGPRLDEVRAEVIEELLAFAKQYDRTVAASVALQNAGNLAEVLGDFDGAEAHYRRGIGHGLPENLYRDLSYALSNVIARPGREVRDFTATTMDGKPVSPESLKGKVYLLDFWATWCGPCIAELPHLQEAYKDLHDKGFEIVSISLDSNKADVTQFWKRNPMPWTHVYDEDRPQDERLADRFGVYGIPHTILVGKDGKIFAQDLRGAALAKTVQAALGE